MGALKKESPCENRGNIFNPKPLKTEGTKRFVYGAIKIIHSKLSVLLTT
jgi:hypothetical protein